MANERKFTKELLDELLAGQDPKTVLSSEGVLGDLKKALAERILDAEMDVASRRRGGAGQRQPSQRSKSEDDPDRDRSVTVVDSAGSARSFRTAV